MKTHWIGIIKWNDGTILRTEPFYKYDEGIKVWSSKFSFENTGKFEWIDYERVEEPKQETVFENAKLTLRKHILENKEQVIKDLDEMREQSNKYETLEEAAERYANNQSDTSMRKDPLEFSKSGEELWEEAKEDFKAGAKWQQERMYSEEEVLGIFHEWFCYQIDEDVEIKLSFQQWFEQFKKN